MIWRSWVRAPGRSTQPKLLEQVLNEYHLIGGIIVRGKSRHICVTPALGLPHPGCLWLLCLFHLVVHCFFFSLSVYVLTHGTAGSSQSDSLFCCWWWWFCVLRTIVLDLTKGQPIASLLLGSSGVFHSFCYHSNLGCYGIQTYISFNGLHQ